ncbi:hypothetical protein M3Y95_00268400 [Aphelenchoides besseyi]|nr:hypothetical protein M3Y95_00268400 [Aphelenchoides besseyi]
MFQTKMTVVFLLIAMSGLSFVVARPQRRLEGDDVCRDGVEKKREIPCPSGYYCHFPVGLSPGSGRFYGLCTKSKSFTAYKN